MNGTTNIYILADVSLSMRRHADELSGYALYACSLPADRRGGQSQPRRGIKVSQKRFALRAEVQRQKDAFGVLAVFVGECPLLLE